MNSSEKRDGWDPAQYARFEAERSGPFRDLLEGTRARIGDRRVARAVDFGCGSGELTRELHESLGLEETIGVDSSGAMLGRARLLPSPKSGVLRFTDGDLATYADSKRFDLIFSNAALQWSADHPTVLSRWRELLNERGQLAVQVPSNHDYPTHLLADALAREPKWSGKIPGSHLGPSVMKPEEYTATLWRAGYGDPRVRLEVYAHVFPDRSFVLEWVKGTLLTSAKSFLGENEYAEYLEEYSDRLMSALPDEKPFLYPFKRILFWANAIR